MKAVNRFLRTLLLMSVLLICCGATHALADDPPVTITQPKAWSAWSYDDTITARWQAVSGATGYYVSVRNMDTDEVVLYRKYTTRTYLKISNYIYDEGKYKLWVGAVASSASDAPCIAQSYIEFYVHHEPEISSTSVVSVGEDRVTLSMDITRDYTYEISDWGFYVGTSSTTSKMTRYSYGATKKGTHTVTITGLQPNTTYYYRAFAENLVGEECTSYKTFTTTAPAIGTPVITYPVDNQHAPVGQSIKLQWTEAKGTEGYRCRILQLQGEPDRTNQSEPYVNDFSDSTSASRHYLTLDGSKVKGGYWYKFVVEAYAKGQESTWSNWCYVYIDSGTLAKAEVVTPVDMATYEGYQSIKFDWNPVAGADGYEYVVKRLSGMPDRTNENEPGVELGRDKTTKTEFTLSASQVIPGYWYKFVVRAYASRMEESWSLWTYCYVDAEKPVISSPTAWTEKPAGSSITVKWGAVNGANGYTIHIKQLSGRPDTSSENEPSIKTWREGCGTSTSYTLSGSDVIGGYWYKFVVEARYPNADSKWSAYVYIYVPENGSLERPIITSPTAARNYESGKSIRFSWTRVSNATSYTYYVKELVGEPDYSENEAASNLWKGTANASSRSFTLDGDLVQPNKWYKFVVKAEANGYDPGWSRYTYIKIPDREDWIYYVMKSAVTNISEQAFADNERLRTFDASSSSLISIESKAFANCVNLKSINLPASVNYIADDAFQNCPLLTIHCITGSYAESYAKSKGIPMEVHGISVETDVVQLSQTNWTIASTEAAETAIRVHSSAAWTASSNASWLSLNKKKGSDGTNVVISAVSNRTNAVRSAKVTFTCGSATAVLDVIQNPSGRNECTLKISQNYWEPSSSELSREIMVQCEDGSFSVESNASWLTYSVKNACVTAKVSASALSSAKTGKLTITCDTCGVSKVVTVSTKGNAVPAPTNVRVTWVNQNTLTVSWDEVPGASYLIESSADGKNWYQIQTPNVGVTSFTNSGLAPNTQYSYRIYARKTISGTRITSESSAVATGYTKIEEIRFNFTGKLGSMASGAYDTLENLSTASWASAGSDFTYQVSLHNLGTNTDVWNHYKVGKATSVSLAGKIAEGQTYRIWVGAYDAAGNLVGQTNAMEFKVKSSTAPKPTIKINSATSKISNSGNKKFAIDFTATNAEWIRFDFDGMSVYESWDKEQNGLKQGSKSEWDFDKGNIDVGHWNGHFYPVPNTPARTYTVTVTAFGEGGSATETVSIAVVAPDQTALNKREKIVAHAKSWLATRFSADGMPYYNRSYGDQAVKSSRVQQTGLYFHGIPYVGNANCRTSLSTYSSYTQKQRQSMVTYSYRNHETSSAEYGLDCTGFVLQCWHAANSNIDTGTTGTFLAAGYYTYFVKDSSQYSVVEIGDVLSKKSPAHVMLVIANDGKSITVIEQTSGNGGQFVPCKCSYCDNDTTLKSLGTRQITYTYSYLYNDGYKVIRRYKECMDGTETDEWGWEKDR